MTRRWWLAILVAGPALAEQCSKCHAKEWKAWASTSMATALQSPAKASLLIENPELRFEVGPYSYLLRREGDHVVIDNDVDSIRGWRVDQILTSDLFGLTTARPPEYEQDLKRRAALASKAKRTRAEEAELKRLDERVGELPAGETATMAKELKAIQETLKLLEEREKATK